jgi:hypothetical protein
LSSATSLVPGGDRGPFVRDTQGQITTQIAWANSFPDVIHLSADGRYLDEDSAFSGTILVDRFAGHLAIPPGASTWTISALSSNGRYVAAFESTRDGRIVVAPNPL